MKTAVVASLIALLPLSAKEVKPIVAIYDLEGPISESGTAPASLLSLDAARPLTLFDITTSLAKAAADANVKAVVLEVDDAQLGLSQIQEIRRRLQALRAAGKDVWLYTDCYDKGTALLGAAANHFTLMPEGDVSFNGMYAESMYFKGLLDKAGIAVDVIHIGDFKSAGEPLYRTGPSEFAKQQEEELVGAVFEQIVGDVAAGRKVPKDQLRAMIDLGTFTAREAMAAGLVDDLQHRTEFSKSVRSAYAGAAFNREYELPDVDGPEITGMFDIMKLMFQSAKPKTAKTDYLAVVPFEGAITRDSIAPVRAKILELLKDPHAKGMVLRVSSPGGSALASEVLWEATDEWTASGRPWVVSMGDVAASGGYYISAGADRIFAENGTLTGSIGVVGMKVVLRGAMEKLGITPHATQRGKNAAVSSMTRSYTDDQAQLVRTAMGHTYQTFKQRVQDGRGNRIQGDLEKLAGGRVYTGRQAVEIGLVDEIGGLQEAIAYLAGKSGVDANSAKLVPEPKAAIEGLFAKPEKPAADDIIRIGATTPPLARTISATLAEMKSAALPSAATHALAEMLQQLEACGESAVQLIAPPLRFSLR